MSHRASSFAFGALIAAVMVNQVHAAPLGQVRDALKQRYPLSRIEIQSQPNEGVVIERGAILTLEADSVPAKKLRIIQANTKSPRFHVLDYARVEIGTDGTLTAGPGDFGVAKGTRLVVLDLKVAPDRVSLFTHTAEPVGRADGKSVYGCMEFVFRFTGGALERSDLAQVQRVIEHWLPFAA